MKNSSDKTDGGGVLGGMGCVLRFNEGQMSSRGREAAEGSGGQPQRRPSWGRARWAPLLPGLTLGAGFKVTAVPGSILLKLP